MKKIGLICLAVVLAVGAMGIGFAHWSQTLFIEGTVNTGSFVVGFSEQRSDDPVESPCNPGAIDDPTRLDPGYTKNVAGCDCELVDPKPCEPGKEAWERMLITVCNAYPSYTNTIDFSIDNCGTVPAIVGSCRIVEKGGVPCDIELVKNVPLNVDLDNDGEGDVDITYSYDGPEPQQIDSF